MDDEINGGAEAPAESTVAPTPTQEAPAPAAPKGRSLEQMLEDSLREVDEREGLLKEVEGHEKVAKAAKAEKRAAAKVAKEEAEAEPDEPTAEEQKVIKAETEEDEAEEQTERDEKGRFKPKNAPETEPDDDADDDEPEDEDAGPAPSRFAEAAKKAWAKAPKEVRDEVGRMQAELEGGIRDYQEQLSGLSDDNKRAIRENNLRYGDVLNKAMEWDRLFSGDILAGMEAMARSKGHSLHDIAAHIVGQAPNADLAGMERAMAEVRNENASLKSKVQQYEAHFNQQNEAVVSREIDDFFTQHPEAEHLAPHIARLIETRFAPDLPTAYRVAQRLYADTPAAVQHQPEAPIAPPARTRDPKAQTQKASLSVSGSPLSGSNPGSRRPAPATVQDAATEALRDIGLNL